MRRANANDNRRGTNLINPIAKEYNENPPDYALKAKKKYRSLTYVQIERQILKRKSYKTSRLDHMLKYVALLYPDNYMHEWRVSMIEGFVFSMEKSKKEYMSHGSSNSQKTSTMVMIVLAVWLIDPEFTSIFVTSPSRDASESGIFADIPDTFIDLKEAHPWIKGDHVNYTIRYDKKVSKKGFIKCITCDKLGKMIGRKQRSTDRGMVMFVCDELPEFERGSIKGALSFLSNAKSIKEFLFWGAGNFSEASDLMGILSEPDLKGGYDALNVDEDQEWETVRGGHVRRYDGHLSPNVVQDEFYYEGLTDGEYLQRLKRDNGGEKSPEYMRFVRSFPVSAGKLLTVLTRSSVRKSGGFDEVDWTTDPRTVYAVCDPSEGGDPAAVFLLEDGYAYHTDKRTGELKIFRTLNIPAPHREIELIAEEDEETGLTIQDQIVEYCVEFNRLNRVKDSHFGFDPSLRHNVSRAFSKQSFDYIGIDMMGKPTDRVYTIGRNSEVAREIYDRRATESHMIVQKLVANGMLKGFDNFPLALDNLCRRTYVKEKGKFKLESKNAFKSGNRGHSPTGGDLLCLAVEVAVQRGFPVLGPEPKKRKPKPKKKATSSKTRRVGRLQRSV